MAKAKKKPNRPLRLEWIEAGSLAENPGNWRRHPDGQMQALRDVLDDGDVGWAGACLYNEQTKRLIDGHARRKAVDPSTPIPVLVGNWSEEAEKKILLTLDPLCGLATADTKALQELLESVDLDTDALRSLGGGLAEMVAAIPADVQTIQEDAVEMRKVDARPPPKMTWVLIGIPTVRFGSISSDVEKIAAVSGSIVETTSNDG